MERRRIDFAVVGQEIAFSVADPIPRGDTQQYLTAHFSVDEAWAGLSLLAVFQRKGRGFSPVTVLLDESMACDFPQSLLTAPEGGGTVYVRVGLIGTGMGGERLTTGCAAVPIAPSCYVRGETPQNPPQDVYTKLLGAIGSKLDANQGAENAGKVLGIDSDGDVVPMNASAGTFPDVPSDGSGDTVSGEIALFDRADGKTYVVFVSGGALMMAEAAAARTASADLVLTDRMDGTTYSLYVENGQLKMQ